MSAPVDVLAVMDGVIDAAIEWLTPSRLEEAVEAHEAVAALIGAMWEILADMESVAPKYRSTESIAQARAALARVTGGQP